MAEVAVHVLLERSFYLRLRYGQTVPSFEL